MRFLPTSLRARLLIGATLFTLVTLGVTLIVMDRVLTHFVTGQIDQRLDNKIVALASQLRIDADGHIALDGNADGPPFDVPRHQSFWWIAGPHNILKSGWLAPDAFSAPTPAQIAASPAPRPPPPGDAQRAPRPRTLETIGPDHVASHLRVVIRDIAGTQVMILAAAPQRAILDPLHEALRTVAGAIVVLGIAMLLAGAWLVHLVLRPLGLLRSDVADIRVGHREALQTDGPGELAPLVGELNRLLAQNAENLARARRHVANLAHGIKTPLATLSLGVGRLNEPDRTTLVPLVDAIERRVRHHLGRARAAALDGPVRSRTNIHAHLVDVVAALEKIHADRSLCVAVDCARDLVVACEPQDLDEMLGNLLENAFKYSSSRVACRVRAEDSAIIVEIEDDGPGLSAEDIQRVLRPGQRLDEQVPGFGFGLPIARELAELYGGELAIASRSPGLRIRLVLPAAR